VNEATRDLPVAIIVMGVSGAGKSTIASLLARRLGFAYEDGDAFHPPANVEKMQARIPLTDEDRIPWLTAIAAHIARLRREGGHAVIACSALRRAYRDLLVGGQGEATRIVYLKGDKQLIARRLAGRKGHFMPPQLLDSQFAALEEPTADEHAIVVSVIDRPHRIVGRIVASLRQEGSRPAGSLMSPPEETSPGESPPGERPSEEQR
jgi:gluconokinase